MLATLLESRPRRVRSGRAGAVSLVAHTLVIGLALYATASADPVEPPPVEAVNVIYHVRPAPPAPAAPSRPSNPAPVAPDPMTPVKPMPPMPTKIPIGIPTPLQVPLGTEFLPISGAEPRTPGTGDPRSPGGPGAGELLTEMLVDRPARLAQGSRTPRYPDQLRRDGITGEVRANFVVDSTGRVEPGSVRILDSAHPLFERAVRDALVAMRFVPAEARGRTVRQLVEQSFLFTLRR